MSYIANINSLAPKKLNYLSRSIIHCLGIDEENNMVQSAVMREKGYNIDMTMHGILTNGINCKFVSYSKRMCSEFLCNIQQIKEKFDGVYFVMYYRNCAAIYYLPKCKYHTFNSYANSQHSNNTNEKQIFINSSNVYQLEPYFLHKVKYSDLVH